MNDYIFPTRFLLTTVARYASPASGPQREQQRRVNMGKSKKVGKNRQDKFYHLAKEQGFRSRASFKLVQLNKRFDFLSSAARGVIDLCAAPGGWMQIARKHMPLGAPCIGIDLVPIRAIPGCMGLVGDITSDTCRGDLRRALKEHHGVSSDEKVDAVLNDGSPNMGKAWLHDAYTQSELTLAALRLATDLLAPGGTFVTKVFRSNDYNSLLYVMNQLFRKVNATKPSASRAESAEIYVMCTGYRAPKAIDPRFLNPKYVFKEMGANGSVGGVGGETNDGKRDLYLNTVLKAMKKRKRHRDGYNEGELTMFHRATVLDFCRSARPVAFMTEVGQFSFDAKYVADSVGDVDEARTITDVLDAMPETSEEVRACCADLKVLGRRDFKLLLKWRSAARTELAVKNLLEPPKSKGNDEDGGSNGTDDDAGSATQGSIDDDGSKMDVEDAAVDSDAEIGEELARAKADMLAKDKRKKRKANKLRSAVQRKIDMKIILPEDIGNLDQPEGTGLFSLKTASRAAKHGAALTDVPVVDPNDADDEGTTDNEGPGDTAADAPYRLGDAEEAWEENTAGVEEELDRWYKVYLSRKKRDKNGVLLRESKERKRITKRRALRDAQAAREQGVEGDAEKEVPRRNLEVNSDASSSEEGVDSDSEDGIGGKDMHVSRSTSNSREAALWFSQPVFAGATHLSSDDDIGEHSDDNVENKIAGKSGKKGSKKKRVRIADEDLGGDHGDEDMHGAARREARRAAVAREAAANEEAGSDFEVAPAEKDNSSGESDGDASDSSFHSSDYDTDEKAEMVAIGRHMRQSKKVATEVLDDAYNRYTFDDPFDLPRWFADPDPQYRERQAPVTKEQVAEMKAYIKSLQAAPTKAEAEAKARRRHRVTKKLEAMKVKANSIAEQADVPASSRMKAIEDLYKNASRSTKSGKKQKRKQYQVVKAGGSRIAVGSNKNAGRRASKGMYKTLVDKRLKSDKRGLKVAAERNLKRGKSRK